MNKTLITDKLQEEADILQMNVEGFLRKNNIRDTVPPHGSRRPDDKYFALTGEQALVIVGALLDDHLTHRMQWTQNTDTATQKLADIIPWYTVDRRWTARLYQESVDEVDYRIEEHLNERFPAKTDGVWKLVRKQHIFMLENLGSSKTVNVDDVSTLISKLLNDKYHVDGLVNEIATNTLLEQELNYKPVGRK